MVRVLILLCILCLLSPVWAASVRQSSQTTTNPVQTTLPSSPPITAPIYIPPQSTAPIRPTVPAPVQPIVQRPAILPGGTSGKPEAIEGYWTFRDTVYETNLPAYMGSRRGVWRIEKQGNVYRLIDANSFAKPAMTGSLVDQDTYQFESFGNIPGTTTRCREIYWVQLRLNALVGWSERDQCNRNKATTNNAPAYAKGKLYATPSVFYYNGLPGQVLQTFPVTEFP